MLAVSEAFETAANTLADKPPVPPDRRATAT